MATRRKDVSFKYDRLRGDTRYFVTEEDVSVVLSRLPAELFSDDNLIRESIVRGTRSASVVYRVARRPREPQTFTA
jgi:hypothetical protein